MMSQEPARHDELPPEFQEDLTLPPSYTQPKRGKPPTTPDYPEGDYVDEDYDAPTGPGCFVWGLVLVFMVLVGVAVVVMAGAAGWTEGKRVAEHNVQSTGVAFADRQLPAIATNVADLNSVQLATRVAFLATRTPAVPYVAELQVTATAVSLDLTATQEAMIAEQLTLIPVAIDAGDNAQVEQRLAFLATQTPGIAQVAELQVAATALAERTAVVTVEETPPTSEATVEPVVESTPEAPSASGTQTFDLDSLLARAQQEISLSQLEDATRTLDLIIRLDPEYQRQTVERLMFDTLRQRAASAYQVTLTNPRNTGTLAEAIRLTDQALIYGTRAQLGDLSYERDVAVLYLSAISAIEAANYTESIQRLERIRDMQAINYKGADINRMLFNQYVAYGDALFQYDREYCRAAQQFRTALTFFADSGVSGKRDNAQSLCEQSQQAQPPPQQGEPLPNETGVAPIGVPGT
jgi:hypothetical protein